ncbi:MAG: YbhB/YbcL family Raf kinase inhibitor-like protein [Cyanobacteria bacterium P01_A01_bin.17]
MQILRLSPIVLNLRAGLIFIALTACGANDIDAELPKLEPTIKLQSSAFAANTSIPTQYTCDGEDRSPPLSWDALPSEAQSLILIADDPDAPGGTFVHWVLYNLSPQTLQLPGGVTPATQGPQQSVQGKNGFGKIGYRGPCPPSGTHRYFFKIYALDQKIEIEPGAKKNKVLLAAKDHIIATGELMGRYSR